jgi:2Fe-2S ferredoxin
MPKVTFMPMNIVCDAKVGESVLDIAINHDIPIQHACGGFCACTTCHIHILSKDAILSDIEEDELDRLELVDGNQPGSRLGCQTKVRSDVVVEVVNIDE